MNELFTNSDIILACIIVFSSIFVFLFNFRHDSLAIGEVHDEDGNLRWGLIALDVVINLGMAFTGYFFIVVVFGSVPQLQAQQGYKYPIAYLFALTSNVSIPIVLKWFQNELQKKIKKIK